MHRLVAFSLALPMAFAADLGIRLATDTVSEAQAACTFCGRVKRVRIKKRRTGSYRLNIDTTSSGNPNGTKVDASLTPVGGGALEITGDRVAFDVASYVTTITPDAPADAMVLWVTVNGESVEVPLAELTFEVDGRGRGPSIQVGTDANGRVASLQATVETDEDGTSVVAFTLKAEGGFAEGDDAFGMVLEGGELQFVETRRRTQLDLAPTEDDTASEALASVTLTDLDGVPLDRLTTRVSLTGESTTPTLDKVRLTADRDGDVKVVSLTSSPSTAPVVLETLVRDVASGEQVLGVADEASVWTERHFQRGSLSFAGEDPTGLGYPVVLIALGEDGGAVGSFDTVVYPTTYTTDDTELVVSSFADEYGQITIAPASEDGDWFAYVWYAAEDQGSVTSFELVFEEPFEGPTPEETVVRVPFRESWSKWVQTSETPLDADAQLALEVVLSDDMGTLADTVEALETEGVAYRSGEGPDALEVFARAILGEEGSRVRTLRNSVKRRRARV